MDKEKLFAQIKGGLIVSCQALEHEPLYTKEGGVMPLMAKAAAMSGAVGIRANTVRDITQIKEVVDLPVIGIIKKDYPGTPMYITVTMKEVDELVACGVDILAVQGTGAGREIADAIRLLDGSGKADVIIVGRGGGSIEELWAFNEEVVARAIYACKTPVVSAVGHETDFTIADFVADLRAPTPSAAAELCVPEYEALNDELEYVKERIASLCTDRIARERKAIAAMEQGAAYGMCHHRISMNMARLSALETGIAASVRQGMGEAERKLSINAARLDSLAPARTLERGYAIIKKGNKYASSAKELAAGDRVEILLSDGTASAKVLAGGKDGE